MFFGATAFNGDLSSWNVSNVTDMARVIEPAFDEHSHRMLFLASREACLAHLVGALFCRRMFDGATAFSGDLSSWNVSNVTNMLRVMSLRSTSSRIVPFSLASREA